MEDEKLLQLISRHGPVMFAGKWRGAHWETDDATEYCHIDFIQYSNGASSFPPFNKGFQGKTFTDAVDRAWQHSLETVGAFKE